MRDEALMEVNLNSTPNLSSKSNLLQVKNGIFVSNGNGNSSVKINYNNLESQINKLIVITENYGEFINSYYDILLKFHNISAKKLLIKKHLGIIVKLINQNSYEKAELEIICLFNKNNPNQKMNNLFDILFIDFNVLNENYLQLIKFLTLQLVLKTKKHFSYIESEKIVRLFLDDKRYLISNHGHSSGSNDKVNLKFSHTIVKLLLNFYNLLPTFKLLFGFKFLEYLQLYKLKFENYITNISIEEFTNQLKKYNTNKDILKYLNGYYIQYSSHNNNINKIMINDIIEKEMIQKNDEHIKESNFKNLTCITNNQFLTIFKIIQLRVHSKNYDKIALKDIIFQLDSLWKLILLEKLSNNENLLLKLFDMTISFVNSNLKQIEQLDELQTLLNCLAEFTITISHYKRLANIIAVSFNCYMIFSNESFLRMSSKLEIKKYLLENDLTAYPNLINKFSKFISSTRNYSLRCELFQDILNIDNLLNQESFSIILQFCKLVYINCFKKLNTDKFINPHNCSEVMIAIIFGYSSPKIPSQDSWCEITKILFYCITGYINKQSDISSKTINSSTPKGHLLYKVELLIKSAYVLNIEMCKHSTSNLGSLTRTIIDKWVVEKNYDTKENISTFEYDFIKLLLNYLSFNNFDSLTIELSQSLKKLPYFETLQLEVDHALVRSYHNLRMIDNIKLMDAIFERTIIDLKSINIEKLVHYLNVKLHLQLALNNQDDFVSFFVTNIKSIRPEVFDVNNSNNLSSSSYIKVLLFNINLYNTASILQMNKNNIKESIIEGKRALKLAVSLIRKSNFLSENCRLNLIDLIAHTYINLINHFVKIGLSRDSEFYVSEFSLLISQLGEPTIVYESLDFLHAYYSLSEQALLANSALTKSNKAFEYIDGRYNINALNTFLYRNNEHSKIIESLNLYFSDEHINSKQLVQFWKLKLGDVFEDDTDIFYPDSIILNSLNHIHSSLQKVQKFMDMDPFFKSMFDSVIAIPSCQFPKSETTKLINASEMLKTHPSSNVCESPRSSNMTPRGKSLKQKFDRVSATNTLKRALECIDTLDLSTVTVRELSTVHSLYSLGSALLSNIQLTNFPNHFALKCSGLADIEKSLPMHFEKELTQIESTIYDSFEPLNAIGESSYVTNTLNEFAVYHNYIQNCNDAFNVISIDTCPLSGHLILSKIESSSARVIHLRLPLNRTNSRELDAPKFSFDEACKELNLIIEQSNQSTSIEVTSIVNTKEDKKRWWKERYGLDKRLEGLLNNINSTWFGGFRGFFDPSMVDLKCFLEFKNKFYVVLHENLPTRKQFRNPWQFIQIEDWIIELFLKIDVEDDNFLNMLEDLIYFVLDILLFHGEENAYDELDINMIFIQLEEHIKRYHSQTHSVTSNKESHTFLILSSVCHNFPFENLSFLENKSVSRVPSLSHLISLLKKNNNKIFSNISIDSNISMILNPNGDLTQTEERFRDEFAAVASSCLNSQLICNNKPDESLFLTMLKNSNLFVYVGHGSGEQFLSVKKIMKLEKISPSFLLGCSSASIKYYGKLAPSSTINAYLLGGSPLVLGNLWDVTDKDIDKFSKSIFSSIHFTKDTYFSDTCSISIAMNKARSFCHLRYLNGAAPVLYGLPFHFA